MAFGILDGQARGQRRQTLTHARRVRAEQTLGLPVEQDRHQASVRPVMVIVWLCRRQSVLPKSGLTSPFE